jgi:membrane associated rhomboid family serine protease
LIAFIKPVTLLLVLANCSVYFIQQGAGESPVASLALWPVESPHFQVHQLVTYSFLHASLTHLALNMIAFLMFAGDIEHEMGWLRFLAYYIACAVSAALMQIAVAVIAGNVDRPTLGASGGVFGILLAFGMLFPRQKLIPMILPIPIPAWLFVTFYGVLELALGMLETQDGVAHFAHLGGMMGGWLLMQCWWSTLRQRRARLSRDQAQLKPRLLRRTRRNAK